MKPDKDSTQHRQKADDELPAGMEDDPVVIPPSAKSPGDFFRIALVIMALMIVGLLILRFL